MTDDNSITVARIPAGQFTMGSLQFYPEEHPLRKVTVESFFMATHLVTNSQFSRFVGSTGYITVAERQPDPILYPHADPNLLVPGALVFIQPSLPVSQNDISAWWKYIPGACWKHPTGPESSVEGKEEHPVVQVAYEDAEAYAHWAGLQLPTEEEWEFAARGGLRDKVYAWGDEFMPSGIHMANTWQGEFPWENLEEDGFSGTSPVKSFPPNGYGLFDMIGNVWEWTRTDYHRHPDTTVQKSCCTVSADDSTVKRKTVKGGSHLCAPNYCLRFRPAARQGQTLDTATNHIGFRCMSPVP